ncbi:MAG: FAD-binding oxidoreductase [Candidatus Cardinium sp.]|nr:FAD-binding oxidoreductase [Candidatus Cardinium sp.]
MIRQPFTVRLREQKMLTPRVIELTFTRTDNLSFHFIPGQFITFLLPNEAGKLMRRSYSLANSPAEGAPWVIAVAAVDHGFATAKLFNLTLGDELFCIGPQGHLILDEGEPTAHYLLVATGTGVTPYRSMLPALAQRLEKDPLLRVTLLLGVRYTQDILYEADFVALAKKQARFHFHIYLSREAMPFSEDYYYSGYVHNAFNKLALNSMHDLVYLCGNPYMIDESKTKLQAMGFSRQQIKQEKYFPAKVLKTAVGNDML